MMRLQNPFSNATRLLFLDAQYICWECGGNQLIQLHHIVGRGSSSPLNAAPLCFWCHNKVTHSNEEQQRYFAKTLKYLFSQQYQLTEKDFNFLKRYPHLIESEDLHKWLGK